MDEARAGRARKSWIGFLVSALCLALTFVLVRPIDIIESLQVSSPGLLSLSLVGTVLFLMMRAVRWRFLLLGKRTWITVFHIQNVGYMMNNLLPLRAGDLVRALLVANSGQVSVATGLFTVGMERVLDMLFIVALLPFTLAEVPSLPGWMASAARLSGVAALLLLIAVVVASRRKSPTARLVATLLGRFRFVDAGKLAPRVEEMLNSVAPLSHLKEGISLAFLTALVWFPVVFAYFIGLKAVNLVPTWSMAGFLVCAAALSVAAPSSPGQVGVFHAGVIMALSIMGQPVAESASFAFAYHALNMIVMVALGVIGLAGIGETLGQVTALARGMLRQR